MTDDVFTKTLTKEDIELGYVFFGDRKVVVLHGGVGDVFRVRFSEAEVGYYQDNDWREDDEIIDYYPSATTGDNRTRGR